MKKIIGGICILLVVAGVLYFTTNDVDNGDATQDSSVYGETDIRVGQSRTIGDLTIELIEVVGDYRCPADAVCIEAGAITAKVRLESSDEVIEKNIPSDEVPFVWKDYSISIVKVFPHVYSGQTIEQDEYIITFNIELQNRIHEE